MSLRTPARILTISLFAAGLALGACDDAGGGTAGPGGGGTATPQDTNTADLTVQDGGGGAAVPMKGTAEAGAEGTFGATISGPMLNIWITSSQGALLTAIIDTSVHNLPGSATMGSPTESESFLSVVDAMNGTNRTSTGGAIVIDQCPKAMGEAFTGKFDNVTLVDAMTMATSTLTGTFNLKVLAASGALSCKVTPTPTPDAGSTDTGGGGGGEYPGAGQASCSNPTCDGPCCPYIPCLSTCTVACETGTCMTNPMDFGACIGCINACITSCEVSQACISAAQAVGECEANNGCDEIENDDAADACLATNCCTELQGAY